MEINKIKQLTKIFLDAGLTHLTLEKENFKICLEKDPRSGNTAADCDQSAAASAPLQEPLPAQNTQQGKSFNYLHEIKSPLAGVFYAAGDPQSPPYVKIGDKVKRGDVLCIVEAMKMMNEITADKDGEIADICAQNEQIVEYAQTLFKIF